MFQLLHVLFRKFFPHSRSSIPQNPHNIGNLRNGEFGESFVPRILIISPLFPQNSPVLGNNSPVLGKFRNDFWAYEEIFGAVLNRLH